MSIEFLQVTWFILVAVLILGFSILSGFDLGVGNLHLLTKKEERAKNFYLIGPFWDSNQVWLLTGGGALFAAFPPVYATAFSGFYLALMLLLFLLIFRAVSIELRSQLDSPTWNKVWDIGFGLGSIIPSILFGVAIGNIMRGLPLDESHNFIGNFFGLLNPYSIVIGLISFAMFTMHGASFLVARTEGDTAVRAKAWGAAAWAAFTGLYIIATAWSYLVVPRLFENFLDFPVLFALPLIALSGMLYYPKVIKSQVNRWSAFAASTVTIVGVLGTLAASLFPYLIPASNDIASSMTIFNASSSQLTLTVMFFLAVVGVPIVLLYTAFVYRKFKGNVVSHAFAKTKQGIQL